MMHGARVGTLVAILLLSMSALACGRVTGSAVGYASNQPQATIDFWYMPNGAQPEIQMKQAIFAFNQKHPNITVRATKVAWGTALTKLNTAAANGEGPDVTQLGTTWVAAFAQAGALQPLTEEEIAEVGGRSAFVPATLGSAGIVGSSQVAALPWFIDTRAVYYRADVLRELGIDPATAFKDWDAMDSTLGTIKAAGKIQAFGMPGKNDWNVIHNFAPWVWEAGGDYISSDGTRPLIASENSVEGVYQYQRMVARYVDPEVFQKNTSNVSAMFAQGKFAVTINNSTFSQWLHTPGPDGYGDSVAARSGYATAPFPAGPNGRSVFFGGSNLAIMKYSRHKAAAYEWMRWLTSAEGQNRYISSIGAIPARAEVNLEPPFSTSDDLKAFRNQLKDGRSYPSVASWATIESVLVTDLSHVWDGVAEANGPISKDKVRELMTKASADEQAAIDHAK